MEQMLQIGNSKVTKKTADRVTNSICTIFEKGQKEKVGQKTLRHGLTVLENVIVRTTTPENMTISGCSFNNSKD